MPHSFEARMVNNQPALWHPANYGFGSMGTIAPRQGTVQMVTPGIGPTGITFPAARPVEYTTGPVYSPGKMPGPVPQNGAVPLGGAISVSPARTNRGINHFIGGFTL